MCACVVGRFITHGKKFCIYHANVKHELVCGSMSIKRSVSRKLSGKEGIHARDLLSGKFALRTGT